MNFITIEFVVFFVIFYSLYLLFSHKFQNYLLLIASYIFYGAWDWRFLSLILFSTVLDYFCGLKIEENQSNNTKKRFLILSLVGNLGLLFFFKYFNFFTDSFIHLLHILGVKANYQVINIVLPVGISFYTFQTLSYTIDIYRREIKPTKKFSDFALFVAFFPQLVAGPIERAKHLLPQIAKPRIVNKVWICEGAYLIFWGLFQKVFIANNLARLVDPVFAQARPDGGWALIIAVYAFTFQLFCDFAAYSNIARGLGRLMGFDIMINFFSPFFVTNVQEFWKRWHISLSTWFKDYVYIPLGGSRVSFKRWLTNIMIVFLLSGIWHGAAWTFVLFGLYYGGLFCLYVVIKPKLNQFFNFRSELMQRMWQGVLIVFIFHLNVLGMMFFRAQSLGQAGHIAKNLILPTFSDFTAHSVGISQFVSYVWLLLIVQYFQYKKNDVLIVMKSPVFIRWTAYALMFILIVSGGNFSNEEFIYFVF